MKMTSEMLLTLFDARFTRNVREDYAFTARVLEVVDQRIRDSLGLPPRWGASRGEVDERIRSVFLDPPYGPGAPLRPGDTLTARRPTTAGPFGAEDDSETMKLLRAIDGEIRGFGRRLAAVEERVGIEEEPAQIDPESFEVTRGGLSADDVLGEPPLRDVRPGEGKSGRELPRPPKPTGSALALHAVQLAAAHGREASDRAVEDAGAAGRAYIDALREAKRILGEGAIAVTSGTAEARRYCIADREGDTEHCYVADSWKAALAMAEEGIAKAPPPPRLPIEKDIPIEVARAYSDELWGKGIGDVSCYTADSSRSRCCVTNGPVGTPNRRMVLEGTFLECFAAHQGLTTDAVREAALAVAREKRIPLPKALATSTAPSPETPAEVPPVRAFVTASDRDLMKELSGDWRDIEDISVEAAAIVAKALIGPGSTVRRASRTACFVNDLSTGRTFLDIFTRMFEFPTRFHCAEFAREACRASVIRTVRRLEADEAESRGEGESQSINRLARAREWESLLKVATPSMDLGEATNPV